MPLGKRTDCGNAKYAGIWPRHMPNVVDGIQEALYQVGFDFIAVSLNHEKLGTGIGSRQADAPRTPIRSDLDLTSQSWTSQVIGVASEPQELWSNTASAEGLDARRRVVSHLLNKELGWASYLGLQAVILPPVDRISGEGAAVVAQVVNKVLASKTYLQVWVQIPVEVSLDQHASHFDKWHLVRALCNHHSQVKVALLLGENLPENKELLSVWDGEPVRAAIIPLSIFKLNSKGYPILPPKHQEFLARLFKFGVQFIIKDDSLDYKLGNNVIKSAQDAEGGPLKVYWEYLSFLFRRLEPLTENEAAEYEYRDYLQSPLQPLQDHLESATYEVFERDKTKYTTYEEAVYKALLDKFSDNPPNGSNNNKRVPTLMVVGAGRGPLVLASLRASKRAKVPVKVFAVEKNPNAYITLLHLHQKEKWGETVTIIHKDMRQWVTREKADIMVSELLGSFGDNELSPECLDGAQRFLAEDGISIPHSYTSYLAPITSSKLHEEVKNLKKLQHLETPYVVRLYAHTVLAENQEVFYFSHPNSEAEEEGKGVDNERFKMLTFRRRETSPPCVLHGFAGYFESVLYKDVLLSIRPETHTSNMFSWFPIYFPLVKPVYLPRGEREIAVSMWRRCDRHKVWYEYALTSPEIQNLVNPEGRSYAAEL
jgi:protein arginine N-methyltransferase 5